MASLYGTITLPKVGQNAANYLQGARQFLPQNQNCPTRTLEQQGFPQYSIDQFGRIVGNDSNQEVGWCGGQFDPQFRMANEVAVGRPQYVTKQGPVDGGLPVATYGAGASGSNESFGVPERIDTLTLAAMKGGSSRYADLTSPALNPMFNPVARATSGAEARQCLGELAFAQLARSTAAANRDVPDASKYAAAGDIDLNLGQPSYASFMNAYAAYLPPASSINIP
jgi:hypothetical protein